MKATRHDEITQLLAKPHPPVWTSYEYWERIEQLEKALSEAMKEVEREPDLPLFGLFEQPLAYGEPKRVRKVRVQYRFTGRGEAMELCGVT